MIGSALLGPSAELEAWNGREIPHGRTSVSIGPIYRVCRRRWSTGMSEEARASSGKAPGSPAAGDAEPATPPGGGVDWTGDAEDLPEVPTERRDFRLLWTGQSVSLFGDQFMLIALPLMAVTTLGSSAAQAALLPFAFKLPFLLLGLPVGAVLDQIRRRPVLIASE